MTETSQQCGVGQSLINTVLLTHAVYGGCLNSLVYGSYQKKKKKLSFMAVGSIYREFLVNGERLNGLHYLITKCVSAIC